MCGFVGTASTEPIVHREWIREARSLISHRGPDFTAEWWSADQRVGMGHVRLSIIDLSPSGNQPMLDADQRICLVLNGEIYNFRDLRRKLEDRGHTFKGRSDTEVLLAAYREWGIDCVARLNGMFALAIWDATTETVFLARDRAGEKPLYYHFDGETLSFASELKALFANRSVGKRVDRSSLNLYLAMGFVTGDHCMVEGVRKLPPAHVLELRLGTARLRTWRYWSIPEFDARARAINDAAMVDSLESLLENAVQRQLVADVPIGILLSGGLDSSLVTAMAVRSCPQVHTFTVRFPGCGHYDETAHARLVSRHFGTRHVELDAADVSPEIMPGLAEQFDDPIVDSSMIPMCLLSELVTAHCTVALGGDGGDELFGGYTHYTRLLWLRMLALATPITARKVLADFSRRSLPAGFKAKTWLQMTDFDFDRGVPVLPVLFDERCRRELMPSLGQFIPVDPTVVDDCSNHATTLVQQAIRRDFCRYLCEDILIKVDRASMLHSLEVRAPFLDQHVVEFAFGKVPDRLKTNYAARKILLRKLGKRVLPDNFNVQRKQGFTPPISRWLTSDVWLDYFKEVLCDSGQRAFARRAIDELLSGQVRGRQNGERLFGLVLFELWRRRYQISMG